MITPKIASTTMRQGSAPFRSFAAAVAFLPLGALYFAMDSAVIAGALRFQVPRRLTEEFIQSSQADRLQILDRNGYDCATPFSQRHLSSEELRAVIIRRVAGFRQNCRAFTQ